MTRRAFTIVELLIFMGISGLFLAVLTQIFHSALDVRLESAGSAAVDQTSAFLFSRLQYDIHRAQSITTPPAPGLSSSTLVLNIGGSAFTYQVSGSALQLTTGSGTDVLTDTSAALSNFSVTRIGNGTGKDTIRISLTLQSLDTTTGSVAQTRQLQTTVGIR